MSHSHASRAGKAQTQGRCVFTGVSGGDGAHLFSAGSYPQYADLPENIFCMSRNHHSVIGSACFDFLQRDGVDIVRPVGERRWMLENLSMDELRNAVRKKLFVMGLYFDRDGLDFPESKQPADYAALMLRGRM